MPPDETKAVIPDLDEGKEYEFRVIPVNEAGPGEASDPTKSVLTKVRRCELYAMNYKGLQLHLEFSLLWKYTKIAKIPKKKVQLKYTALQRVQLKVLDV